tara:strand:- start:27679 stop:28191 length:513 start_codon:yes stop_codon:yes gene_type:complete
MKSNPFLGIFKLNHRSKNMEMIQAQELEQEQNQKLDIEQENTYFDIEELLRHEILEFNDYRRENPTASIDLCERNLSGIYIGSANLRNANLNGSNLSKTKGDMIDFSNSDLRDARFWNTNYRFINLHGAKIKQWQVPMLLQALGVQIEDDRDLSITIKHSKQIKIKTEEN